MATAKILLIEDDPSDIYVLQRQLKERDSDVELQIVRDGGEALQFVRQGLGPDPTPCVILLDLHLPKHDGLEILHAIREDPELRHVHVIVVTNAASPQEQAELSALGIAFRLKPCCLEEFTALANDLIAICHGLITPA